jgi:carbon monoxide dehydrogenase subunit G
MRLTNTVPVKASPDEVFALVNDVERVASCMPGASLDGRDGDAWVGRVRIKVGPITAAYSGSVRFLEVDAVRRRLRVQASGADTHGSGDAEAEVVLDVVDAPEGARLQISTDLVIRGKIAQFGKGAIATVSDKILQQFAQNLGGLLDQDRALGVRTAQPGGRAPAVSGAPATSGSSAHAAQRPAVAAQADLDGLSMIVGPVLSKYGPLVGVFAFGLFEGWLLGRLVTREKQARAAGRPA